MYAKANRDIVRERSKIWMASLRSAAFAAYGGARCACCGETELGFLTLDHVNNDGAPHRREIGGSANLLVWLRRKGYPPGFQILCFNCNLGRALNGGICPHAQGS